MEIEIKEPILEVGSIVELKDRLYIVNELPSCVYYETKPEWRHYLHDLSGAGFYDYPYSLEILQRKINHEWGGKIYSSKHYKCVLQCK